MDIGLLELPHNITETFLDVWILLLYSLSNSFVGVNFRWRDCLTINLRDSSRSIAGNDDLLFPSGVVFPSLDTFNVFFGLLIGSLMFGVMLSLMIMASKLVSFMIMVTVLLVTVCVCVTLSSGCYHTKHNKNKTNNKTTEKSSHFNVGPVNN